MELILRARSISAVPRSDGVEVITMFEPTADTRAVVAAMEKGAVITSMKLVDDWDDFTNDTHTRVATRVLVDTYTCPFKKHTLTLYLRKP